MTPIKRGTAYRMGPRVPAARRNQWLGVFSVAGAIANASVWQESFRKLAEANSVRSLTDNWPGYEPEVKP